MRLPELDRLIGEQMVVYEHDPDLPLFVAGPPGSGKTSLAVWRASYLGELGKSVAIVTRNRLLASLAAQLSGDHAPVACMTMHRFFMQSYRRVFGGDAKPPGYYDYNYDWDAIVEQYDKAAETPVLDHLVVDEGQNLPAGFFRWAIRFAARTITVFADEDQTTDDKRASLDEIMAAGMPPAFRLTRNHRNTAEIADVAEHFHDSATLPPGIVASRRRGEKPQLQSYPDWKALSDNIALRYRLRGGAVGVILYLREDVRHLQSLLSAALPDTRVDFYTGDKEQGFERGIQFMEAGITVLSSESAIGLEFATVYLQDLDRSLPCATRDDFRRMYMLCARARDTLILVDGPLRLADDQLAALPGPVQLTR